MNCLYRLMNTVSTKVFQKTKVLQHFSFLKKNLPIGGMICSGKVYLATTRKMFYSCYIIGTREYSQSNKVFEKFTHP